MTLGRIRLGDGAGDRRIRISYDIVTPESAEEGDVEESGWEDEEGTSMEPDKFDKEEGLTAVDLAVRFLKDQGATEPSSYPTWSTGTWYRNTETDYRDGSAKSLYFHLVGFSSDEEKKIYKKIKERR